MRCLLQVVVVASIAILVTQPAFGSELQATEGTANAVRALAFDVASHPQAEAVDLYKFLQQAMFGPGHAIADSAQAEDALQREIAELGAPLPEENWCDALGGDPLLVRVNLRPFVANASESAALAEAFVATANAIPGDPQQMAAALDLVVRWLRAEDRHDLAGELRQFAREMAEKGYPPVHHSAAYRQAYRPAYRVVLDSAASANGWCGSN